MSLLDFRGRPLAEVPIDEARLAALVATRCTAWRSEPSGIPRAPDFDFFRLKLVVLTDATRTAIARLWAAERATRGPGGAIGIATFDRLPDDNVLERFDRSYTRMMRKGGG